MDKDLWKEINQQEKIPDEIWVEVEKVSPVVEPRLSGDIDYRDVMNHYKVSSHQATDIMRKMVESGKFKFVAIMQKGHNIKVIRLLTTSNSPPDSPAGEH